MNYGILKTSYYALIPLLILLFFAALSAALSYCFLTIAGDVISMRKIVSKAAQVFLLLSIFPIRRYLKLTWADVGFAPKRIFIKQVLLGFILGLITLMPVLLVLYALEVSIFDIEKQWTPGKMVLKISLAFLLATLISLGEEPLFSGILLAGLQKKMATGLAVIICSSYYAAFHFVKTKTHIPYEELTFASGFELMAEAFTNLLNPEITSAFIGLLAVGMFLAVIRTQLSNSIGICIGCHATWVWQIKISKDFFNTNENSEYYFLVSSYYDGVVGYLVSTWLLFCLLVYFIWKNFSQKKSS